MLKKIKKEEIIEIASKVSDIIMKETGGDTTVAELVMDQVKSQIRIEVMLPIYNDNR